MINYFAEKFSSLLKVEILIKAPRQTAKNSVKFSAVSREMNVFSVSEHKNPDMCVMENIYDPLNA